MAASDSQSPAPAPPLGARLDLSLIRKDLGTQRLGTKFHYFQELDSTNSRARDLAEQAVPVVEIVVSEYQTHGRGRLGRRWGSPPLATLYFSAILRPKLSSEHAAQITLMAAVAVADAAVSFIPQSPTIKWPNDVLVDGKKLAGILAEASCDADRVTYVVLGIGINVNFPRDSMPVELRQRATSFMQLTGFPLEREIVFRRLIQDRDRCYGVLEMSGFDALRPRWEARFNLAGRRVRGELDTEMITGVARGIDRHGALVLEDQNGTLRNIVAGDVIPLES